MSRVYMVSRLSLGMKTSKLKKELYSFCACDVSWGVEKSFVNFLYSGVGRSSSNNLLDNMVKQYRFGL